MPPPVTHALVHAHPETGDRSIYFDSTTIIGIDYMDTASGLALLDELYQSVTQRGPRSIDLRNVADVTQGTVLGEIDRYNMQRMLTLAANIGGEDLGGVADQVSQAIAK